MKKRLIMRIRTVCTRTCYIATRISKINARDAWMQLNLTQLETKIEQVIGRGENKA